MITGGDSGIGRAVAIAYAREGADVALSFLVGEQEDAEDTAGLVEQAGRHAALLPGDLTDRTVAENLPTRAVHELGGLDVLINNAGYQMAPAYVFLAAPAEASYVSGTVLGVTGGKPVF